MEGNDKKPYWSKEIADMLGIGTSTLRKWCLILERNGYRFLRDEHDRRAYTEHDAIALRKLKDLTEHRGMTLDNASIVVIETLNRDKSQTVTLSATPGTKRANERHDEIMAKLESVIEEQKAFNKVLLDRLNQQQEYIDERLNKRDELLMKTLREELETRKQLAAASEEKSRFWSRLFGKK